MIIGEVIGNVVSSIKNTKLEGSKLLIIQPLFLNGTPNGKPIIAVDSVNAGAGDRVLVVLEGRAASNAIGSTLAPVEAACVGIVDEINLSKQ